MTSTIFPAFSGFPGPGEITIWEGLISFNFVETDWWCQTAHLFRLNTVFKEVASWVAAEDVFTGGFYQKKSKNLTLTATGSFPNIFKVLSYCDLQYELESW